MRIAQIQGLRALAALLVVVFHARLLPGGFIGVDIFYVISGYLITGLILREIENTGRLDLAVFYQRRIKRLLPTSVFVLFVTAIVAMFLLPAITRAELGRDLFAAATYISNYLFAWWQNDYQNLNATPSPFIHYWSLAVEEQFYLVWPIFILFLAGLGKRAIVVGVSVTTFLSLAYSIYLTQASPIWAFYSLPTRAWELGTGALLLFIPQSFLHRRFIPWLGLLVLTTATLTFDENTAFPGVNAVLPVVATAVLIGSIGRWPQFFNDLSNNRVAQWLGAISYPIYLWHWPALVLPSSALGRPLRVRERLLLIVLTIILAHLTSKFIEQPMRHKKIAGRKIFQAFGLTTGLSIVVGLMISATSSSMIDVKGTNFSFDLTTVVAKPIVYGDGCHVNYGETKSGNCTYGDLTSKTTIVLYGDSHAAQWFPALLELANKQKFKLISLTKSACPSVDSPRPDQGAFKNISCKKWRENSIARIQAVHPDAVIISNFQYYTPAKGNPNKSKWWGDGQQKLLAQLQGTSKHLIYISDTPRPVRDIPSCLATRSSHTCDSTEKTPAVIINGFQKINPTRWLCTSFCPAIQDGYVVYRDASHISVAAAIALSPQLAAKLVTTGLFR